VTPPRTLPRLHLVTDDRVVARKDFLPLAGELLAAGGTHIALHLRAPFAGGSGLHRLAEELMRHAAHSGARLFVNDRVDVALGVGADGVQLGRGSLEVADARALLGADHWIGASVHDAAEAASALRNGADFLLAGTLYASGSHPGFPGSGLEWLSQVTGARGRLIGIGGVTVDRVGDVLSAGAHGVAVISAVWDAPRPRESLARFIEALYRTGTH
jgi:thiamine-phosphate diphosphorylase